MSLAHQWQHFVTTAFPTRKNEHWRHVDVSHLKEIDFDAARAQPDFSEIIQSKKSEKHYLLVFMDGKFSEPHSDVIPDVTMSQIKENQPICSIKYPFAVFNQIISDQTFAMTIHATANKPIYCLHLSTSQLNHFKMNILLEAHVKAHVIQFFASHAYLNNIVTDIVLEKNAELTHEKIQSEGDSTTHLAATFVTQKEESHAVFNYLNIGARLSRDDLVVRLAGQGASCHTNGAYQLSTQNQCVDYHIDIQHAAKNTTSDMYYKGILGDKTQAIFNGRLLVEKNAQHISSKQGNHHLLLSDTAASYSKPELEIYADDVKCQHGATTGELDEEALFYLKARGIDQETAKTLLLNAFMSDVLDRMPYARECV